MINLKKLEELRTKEEVLNYFKQLGKNITEEELTAIKQSYGKMQESSGALTMQQLDDVAGGIFYFIDKTNGKITSSPEIVAGIMDNPEDKTKCDLLYICNWVNMTRVHVYGDCFLTPKNDEVYQMFYEESAGKLNYRPSYMDSIEIYTKLNGEGNMGLIAISDKEHKPGEVLSVDVLIYNENEYPREKIDLLVREIANGKYDPIEDNFHAKEEYRWWSSQPRK